MVPRIETMAPHISALKKNLGTAYYCIASAWRSHHGVLVRRAALFQTLGAIYTCDF